VIRDERVVSRANRHEDVIMDASVTGSLVALVAGGTLLGVPAVAWAAWLRRARPRPLPLLFVALVTTAPLATSLMGVARILLVVRSFGQEGGDEPSQNARVLAETISGAMNANLFALSGAAVTAAVIIVGSRWRHRHRPR
jgi:hypothetical protein